MPSVDGEIRTQKRVIDWLVDDLGVRTFFRTA